MEFWEGLTLNAHVHYSVLNWKSLSYVLQFVFIVAKALARISVNWGGWSMRAGEWWEVRVCLSTSIQFFMFTLLS